MAFRIHRIFSIHKEVVFFSLYRQKYQELIIIHLFKLKYLFLKKELKSQSMIFNIKCHMICQLFKV